MKDNNQSLGLMMMAYNSQGKEIKDKLTGKAGTLPSDSSGGCW